MTPADLAKLEALRAKATPGEWSVGYTNSEHPESSFVLSGIYGVVPNVSPQNGELIVAAVNALPQLLAAAREGERVRAALAELVAAEDAARRPIHVKPGEWKTFTIPSPEGVRAEKAWAAVRVLKESQK